MMARSRKKKSRKEIRRRRQLREIEQRTEALKPKLTREETPLRRKVGRHVVELILAGFVVFGVLTVLSLGPDKEKLNELRKSFDPVLYADSFRWNELYNKGYKVFALRESDIIETTFDSLPDDFKVDWDKVEMARIQADRLDEVSEKIEIAVNGIEYASQDVSGASVRAKLSRRVGASAVLAVWGDEQFSATIVKEDDGVLFCLLGLRKL